MRAANVTTPPIDLHTQPILPPINLRQYHILVADANHGVRTVVARMIAYAYPCATITVLSSGMEVLLEQFQRHVDLFIIDYHMPVVGGFDLIYTLCHCCTNPAIIVITGDISIEIEACNAGASYVLAKPFGMHDLIKMTAALMP